MTSLEKKLLPRKRYEIVVFYSHIQNKNLNNIYYTFIYTLIFTFVGYIMLPS